MKGGGKHGSSAPAPIPALTIVRGRGHPLLNASNFLERKKKKDRGEKGRKGEKNVTRRPVFEWRDAGCSLFSSLTPTSLPKKEKRKRKKKKKEEERGGAAEAAIAGLSWMGAILLLAREKGYNSEHINRPI